MASFTPPDVSAALCENVPFESAFDTAIDHKAAFDAFDQTPEGENDPSRCKALLAFPDGTIFWSSKMAIDADGPAAGGLRLSGSQLDPDSGQNEGCHWHFSRRPVCDHRTRRWQTRRRQLPFVSYGCQHREKPWFARGNRRDA